MQIWMQGINCKQKAWSLYFNVPLFQNSERNLLWPHGGTAYFWLIHLCVYIYIYILAVTLRGWEGILSILKCLTSWIKFSTAGTQGRQGTSQSETERERGDLSDIAADLLTSKSPGGHRPSNGEKRCSERFLGDGRSSCVESVTALDTPSSCQTPAARCIQSNSPETMQTEPFRDGRGVKKDGIVLFCT